MAFTGGMALNVAMAVSIPKAGAYAVMAPTFGTNEGGLSLTGVL